MYRKKHSIHKVWHYPWFQASMVGVGHTPHRPGGRPDVTTSNPHPLPKADSDGIHPSGPISALGYALFHFKTFYYGTFRNVQQQKKHFSKLSCPFTASLTTCSRLTLSLAPHPSPCPRLWMTLEQSPEGHSLSLRILYQESSPTASLDWAPGLLKSQPLGAAGWGLSAQGPLGSSFAHPSGTGGRHCLHDLRGQKEHQTPHCCAPSL